MVNKKELSEKIRTLRNMIGLNQGDLAAKAGVSIRVIRDLEGATGNLTIESLDLVADVLGVPLHQILTPGESAGETIAIKSNPSNPAQVVATAADRPTLILEIQDLLKGMSQEDLETLKASAENLITLANARKNSIRDVK